MNAPQRDPLNAMFDQYAAATAAETTRSTTGQLRRRMRRHRTARVAAAGVAAAVLAAPAGWALQQTATADEQTTEQAADEPTPEHPAPSEEEERYLDMLGPTADLVGAAMDLPSFVPGNADVDEVCGAADVVLGDGSHEEPIENGAVFFIQGSGATLSEGTDDWYEVGLFGCRYGEETLYQVVTLEEVEDDTWVAAKQLVHSELGGESPQYIIVSARDGLVVGFAERYDPEADDLRYWADKVTLDADGTPVREPLGELDGEGFSELSVEVTSAATDEPGVWTVTVAIRNTGPRAITDYVLHAAADEEVEVLSGEPVTDRDNGGGAWNVVAEIDEIGVGQVYTQEWTVAVDEPAQDGYAERPIFIADFMPVTPYEEMPEVARTLFWGEVSGWGDFTE